MLKLVVKITDDGYNDEEERFVNGEVFILELEHSLVSLSKWEARYKKAFLGPVEKTSEEVRGYIEAMCISPFVPLEVFDKLTGDHIKTINEYIEDKMTATTFNDPPSQARSREIITSELIYFWMTSYQIPWEAERWHLNRLFTLIKIFSAKNAKPKKMGKNEAAAMRSKLNAERRAKMGTNG